MVLEPLLIFLLDLFQILGEFIVLFSEAPQLDGESIDLLLFGVVHGGF
jgi:hypothetical protein